MPIEYLSSVVLAAIIFSNLVARCGGYSLETFASRRDVARGVLISWPVAFCAVLLAVFFSKQSDNLSRLWTAGWFFSSLAALLAERLVILRIVAAGRRAGKLVTRTAIATVGPRGSRRTKQLCAMLPPDVHVLGVFSIGAGRTTPRAAGVDERWRCGTIEDLVWLCQRSHVDEVVILLPRRVTSDVRQALRTLRSIAVNVSLCPEALLDLEIRPRVLRTLANVPLLRLYGPPIEGSPLILKRAMDVVLAGAALILSSPLMGLIAIAIKLDSPGPVLFTQARFGFNNHTIMLRKFRTMRADAGNDPAAPQAMRHDPRVTRVGRFLRRTSLDELPQFLNVLSGEMSLVGPRPHAVAHNEEYAKLIEGYTARHRVKPGITGWAQVNGLRGETTTESMRARVEHDLFYIENWSLPFDVKILVRTLFVGFVHPKAY